MRNFIYKGIAALIALTMLSGCTSNLNDPTDNNPLSSPDEPTYFEADKTDIQLDKVHESTESDIELNLIKKAYIDNDEFMNVSVSSVRLERNQIVSVSPDQYKYFIMLHDNALSEDMTLDSNYVYLSVDISISGDKSYDRLYVSSFKLYYTVDGTDFFEEMAYQNAMAFSDSPHDIGVISYSAGEEKNVTIGYIVPNQIVNSENICLLAAFASSEDDTEKSPMFKIADGTTFE